MYKCSVKKQHIVLNEKSILSVNADLLNSTERRRERKVFILPYDYFASTLCPKEEIKFRKKQGKITARMNHQMSYSIITDGRTD